MENNEAFVATLRNIQPIEGADRIVKADVTLNGTAVTQVVVGKDTQEGDKVVYFDANMCLNPDTILIDYPKLGDYLGRRGRVRTVKLRNTFSDGLCVPVSDFTKYERNAVSWEEGFSFIDINGVSICYKYVPPAPKQATQGRGKKRKGKVSSRVIPELWNFHVDTKQLARNMGELDPDDVISISRKTHGCSSVVSHIPVKRKLTIADRVAKFLGAHVQETEYDYLYSSRRVIKNGEVTPHTGFYSEDIWTKAGKQFEGKLAKGETVYFEILGYLSTEKFIQKDYDYGCRPGEHKIQVYRITKTSPDGHVA